jgi:excisionase family DNA binding protein
LNLRPPGPEGTQDASHGVSERGTESQPVGIPRVEPRATSDALAQNAPRETPLGAPVVRALPLDPGPHEFLLTAKMVAERLGVCTAVVYKLCANRALPALRIGGALRFEPDAVRRYIERIRTTPR